MLQWVTAALPREEIEQDVMWSKIAFPEMKSCCEEVAGGAVVLHWSKKYGNEIQVLHEMLLQRMEMQNKYRV